MVRILKGRHIYETRGLPIVKERVGNKEYDITIKYWGLKPIKEDKKMSCLTNFRDYKRKFKRRIYSDLVYLNYIKKAFKQIKKDKNFKNLNSLSKKELTERIQNSQLPKNILRIRTRIGSKWQKNWNNMIIPKKSTPEEIKNVACNELFNIIKGEISLQELNRDKKIVRKRRSRAAEFYEDISQK